MNKNIISVGILLTMASEISSLTGPSFDLYSDGLGMKSNGQCYNPSFNQISQTQLGRNLAYEESVVYPMEAGMTMRMLEKHTEEADIMQSVVKRIESSKPLPAEFSKIIDDNFWDLI